MLDLWLRIPSHLVVWFQAEEDLEVLGSDSLQREKAGEGERDP